MLPFLLRFICGAPRFRYKNTPGNVMDLNFLNEFPRSDVQETFETGNSPKRSTRLKPEAEVPAGRSPIPLPVREGLIRFLIPILITETGAKFKKRSFLFLEK
jgi:hypothetical protein